MGGSHGEGLRPANKGVEPQTPAHNLTAFGEMCRARGTELSHACERTATMR